MTPRGPQLAAPRPSPNGHPRDLCVLLLLMPSRGWVDGVGPLGPKGLTPPGQAWGGWRSETKVGGRMGCLRAHCQAWKTWEKRKRPASPFQSFLPQGTRIQDPQPLLPQTQVQPPPSSQAQEGDFRPLLPRNSRSLYRGSPVHLGSGPHAP